MYTRTLLLFLFCLGVTQATSRGSGDLGLFSNVPVMDCHQPYWSWNPIVLEPFSTAEMNCKEVNSFSLDSGQLHDVTIQVERNGKHQRYCDGVDHCHYSRFKWFETDSYQILWINPTNYTREIRFLVEAENSFGWDIAFTVVFFFTAGIILLGMLGLAIFIVARSIRHCHRRKFDYHLIDADDTDHVDGEVHV